MDRRSFAQMGDALNRRTFVAAAAAAPLATVASAAEAQDPAIAAAADFVRANMAFYEYEAVDDDDETFFRLERESDEAYWRCIATTPTTDRGRLDLLRVYLFDLSRNMPDADGNQSFDDAGTWRFEDDWADGRGPELVKNALRGIS